MSEKVRTDELTRKQETFIAARLTLPTIEAAAAAAGVTSKTARQWMRQPYMQAAYKAARRQVFEMALETLQDVVEEAIKTLRTMMGDEGAPHGVRVRAAQILLEQALSVHKVEDLEERLLVMEEALRERPA